MDLNEYQKASRRTKMYPEKLDGGIYYSTLGLCGEAGELANKVKKIARDNNLDKEGIKGELGDILWYVASVSEEIGYSLEEIANYNLEKLNKRMEEGKISGNGDER
ncbi:NTP pyrophosphatase, house-cleaning of non-canonical NTPs [Candidatus Mancarchaeum acidiphilum]|uniref:NTP pyrophosphatase, house-cleaning of non-canonical NTPs n=1 Tax=Candidatus Mancarchaeum acidiphilum TaxID=1920749 RepID=A0A218NMM8_9ARCH|nr:nucleoside triphosphate pyrophosphohydrolase family protein [Candidatus Mancarchaeum acidiphilum]ASI13706.1 NTP pyrophosphatase, house-cleaning of non-canonical NTPs [Candidatus Mancarchaeum acidiphilum]